MLLAVVVIYIPVIGKPNATYAKNSDLKLRIAVIFAWL